MFKRIASMALIVLLVGSMSSCIFDPENKKTPPDPPEPWPDLTEPWHVLATLQRAYNDRNIDRYASIFDTEFFTFFFNPGDVGGDIPEQWNYLDELGSATNMFSGGGGKENNPILSIELTLSDIESASFVGVPDDRFPGETLQQTNVVYSYYIDTENDTQYITSGAPVAQFTVREIGGKWQLVSWADLSGE